MTEADWVTTAMADNDVVAEVLIRLRLPSLPSKHQRPAPPPQSWTIHQRRSRTQPQPPGLTQPPNKSDTPRASPSTPLSWSSATSIVPQPNHNNCSDVSRSKIKGPIETKPSKRPRKKKTLAALKEEGIVLMEEQNDLKRKLAVLQADCEKQRKENERLKKIKLDIQVELQRERPMTTRNDHFEVVNELNGKTVLPDLNIPFGEDVIVSY